MRWSISSSGCRSRRSGTTLGALLSATAAGYLFAISPGAPFIVSSVVFVLVSVALCLPTVVRLFPAHTPRAMTAVRSATMATSADEISNALLGE